MSMTKTSQSCDLATEEPPPGSLEWANYVRAKWQLPAVDGEGHDEFLDDDDGDESLEATDEATEDEYANSQHLEIKEQMYQDKLASLKKQIQEVRSRSHPEYVRRVRRLQEELDDRLLLNECSREYQISCAERDCILEKNAAAKEYEEKKAELKENLVNDLEDRKKMIELEFSTMELNGDSIDVKPTVTRKLRRRPNEPLPVPEKRRKPTTGQLVFLLDEKEVENDLKLISRGKPILPARGQQNSNGGASASNLSAVTGNSAVGYSSSASSAVVGVSALEHNGTASYSSNGGPLNLSQNPTQLSASSIQQQQQQTLADTRIEDGKLLHERRWFHRGQPVFVEGKELSRFSANISAIGSEAIWVKKTVDGQKFRIFLSHLRRGKVAIKRRAN
ncbi:suppressor of defective silencing [Anopheles darlingi]|uniref:Suppressor of defective silencing n=1 Tax=Anopheles darlingi TaxID=43151 RepID=W5JVT6_ANODA|nr:sin3 histone deacetylase corepressor complex component SDS3 isoform X2 [Anopheles darlingi]ETN67185.1 suppressor of defective silencing [Anopheles darlingi]